MLLLKNITFTNVLDISITYEIYDARNPREWYVIIFFEKFHKFDILKVLPTFLFLKKKHNFFLFKKFMV